MILKKHPEILNLMHSSSNITIYIAIGLIVLQFFVTYYIRNTSWFVFLFVGYWVGGTIAHTSHVLVHDLTHMLGHANPLVNRVVAMMCNTIAGLPSAISFGKYHSDHHNYQGEYGIDSDLPCVKEAEFVNTPFRKFCFLFFITFIYAFRPVLYFTKKLEFLEYVNIAFILTTDYLIYHFLGPSAIGYIALCAFLSIGPHPAALHTIAEHFEMSPGVETYDYIGFWNFFSLNIGYHTEHHDFPNIPWYNLKKVREIAKEFYENLPVHSSYVRLAYKFVCDPNFGLFHRTLRVNPKNVN